MGVVCLIHKWETLEQAGRWGLVSSLISSFNSIKALNSLDWNSSVYVRNPSRYVL